MVGKAQDKLDVSKWSKAEQRMGFMHESETT